MKPVAFAFVLTLTLAGTAQSTLRDALDWTHDVLLETDTQRFAERLMWADSILASRPDEAAERMGDVLHLFPSFQQSEQPADAEALKLLWAATSFEAQNREQLENLADAQLPFTPPPGADSSPSSDSTFPWLVGLAAVAACALALGWMRERRKNATFVEDGLAEDFQQLFDQIASHTSPSEYRIDLIQLAFEHERHPVQLARKRDAGLNQLTSLELMLSALLHDDISMEEVELVLAKSRGTLYNMRSQLRKKLNISEQANLTAALQSRCAR